MKSWFSNIKASVADHTAGETSKREKARIVGSLIANKISTKASRARTKVSQKAMDCHDHILLKRHERALSSQANSELTAGGTNLRVEIVAATDLRTSSVGDPDPYCMLTVGIVGHPWAVKVANNPQVKTNVALRERHPRWNTTVSLSMSEVVCCNFADTELTVRVMDAHTTRKDTVLGEARVALGGEPFGARTVRLQGGGFASLSLRWSLAVGDGLESNGDSLGNKSALEQLRVERKWREMLEQFPFDGAAVFWAEHSVGGNVGANELAELAFVLSESALDETLIDARKQKCLLEDIDEDGLCDNLEPPQAPPQTTNDVEIISRSKLDLNELILQAPLVGVMTGDAGRVSVVIGVLGGRIPSLTLLARSRIIGALVASLSLKQIGETIRQSMEKLLLDLFLSTTGNDLVDLKRLVDTGGIGQDLMAACSTLAKSSLHWSLVGALYDHFREEAGKLKQKITHVLSDIDMTVWVGTFGAGGPKFPKGPVPGALTLYELLGRRTTFLSARPPIWESRTRGALLNDIGIAEATLLQGTLENVVKYVYDKEAAHKGMGEQKEKVFKQFACLHPDARFVFFGDSGEGDVDFALAFISDNAVVYPPDHQYEQCPDRLAFIHDVVMSDGIETKTSAAQRESLRVRGVHIFDTYLGAAKQLFLYGLFDQNDLQCAAERIVEEFAQIPLEEYKSIEVFNARQEELNRDLEAVNTMLGIPGFLEAAQELLPQTSPYDSSSTNGYPSDSANLSVTSDPSLSLQSYPSPYPESKEFDRNNSTQLQTLKSGESSDSDDEPLLT